MMLCVLSDNKANSKVTLLAIVFWSYTDLINSDQWLNCAYIYKQKK